jgi:holo-[acyl-carrier protein] synthase
MIAGIGIDLVPVEKIAESIESEAFRQRVFTPAEIEACQGIYNAAERYAGKFAAKEAFMKAVGRGIRQEVWFSQIEVLSSETGAPYILVHGEAERSLQALEAKTVHVSISHTREAAIAIVIVEGPG